MEKIVIGLLVLGVVLYLLSLYTFNAMTRNEKYPEVTNYTIVTSKGVFTNLDQLNKEEVSIVSHDNLVLSGSYLPNSEPSKKTIVLVHGYRVYSSYMLQYVGTFLDKGWNVLLMDQRSHGKSEGKFASYGYHEKQDLDRWVNWLIEKHGKDATIGLLGVSMGGGTVLEYLAINKYVKFVIADCPYSDLKELMHYQLWQLNHVPPFPVLNILDLMLKKRIKFKLADVSPLEAVKDSELPVMFVHGSNDNYVPTYMSKKMYDAKKGTKKLLIIDGAVHANAYGVNQELYEKEMWLFIEEAILAK
mgnify:FL=1